MFEVDFKDLFFLWGNIAKIISVVTQIVLMEKKKDDVMTYNMKNSNYFVP